MTPSAPFAGLFTMENSEGLGCVYFVKLNGLSPIKIGYSSYETPGDRLRAFETCSPYGVELVGFIQSNTAKVLERELHARFSAFRLNGEWFEISKEQARSVCEAMMSDSQRDKLSMAYELISKGFRLKKESDVIENPTYPLEFDKWFRSVVVYGERMNKSHIYGKFIKDSGLEKDGISQKRLTQWMTEWAKENNLSCVSGKSHFRWIMINFKTE